MSDATWLLETLARTTLWLTGCGLLAWLVLRVARPSGPAVHRAAWLLVLVVGWTFVRLPLTVPVTAPVVSSANRDRDLDNDTLPTDEFAALPSPQPSLESDGVEFVELKPAETTRPHGPPTLGLPAGHPVMDIREQVALKQAADVSPESAALDLDAAAVELAGTSPSRTEGLAQRAAALRDLLNRRWPTWTVDVPLAIVGVWAAGMLLFVAAWLIGYVRFVRRLRDRRTASDLWSAEWHQLTASALVNRPIPLTLTNDVGPVLCRLPRGYELIVPEPLWRDLDASGRQAILRHELAHYLRGDVWKSLAVRGLALPHWFNPVSWLALRRFDEAAEWACDLAASGDVPATDYAKVLVQLGQQPRGFGYGSAARGSYLARRVRRLLAGPTREDSTMKKGLLLAAAIGVVAASIVQFRLVAREPAAADTPAAVAPSPGETTRASSSAAGPLAGLAANDQEGSPAADPADDPPPIQESAIEALEFLRAAQVAQNESAQKPEQGFGAGGAKKDDAAPNMVDVAERAYEALQAAYEAETVELQSLLDWSLRWYQEARAAAQNDQERIAAARDHLDRMVRLQKKVQLLFERGSRGGEANRQLAATFYANDARRLLEKAEAAARSKGGGAVGRLGGLMMQAETPSRELPAELNTIDLKIRIAELRGEMQQSKALLEAAIEAEQAAELGVKTQTITTPVLARARAERRGLEVRLQTLEEQLALQQAKLKLIASYEQPPKKRTAGQPVQPLGITGSLEAAPQLISGDAIRLVDLKIEIAKLRGDLDRARTELERAETDYLHATQLEKRQPGVITKKELSHHRADVDRAQALVNSLTKQYELQLEKLAMLTTRARQVGELFTEQAGQPPGGAARRRQGAQANQPDNPIGPPADPPATRVEDLFVEPAGQPAAGATPTTKTTPTRRPDDPPAVPVLLYDGRDYDAWAHDLRTDLSPQRRAEAIGALATFAQHGYGRAAAETIMDVMKGYTLWPIDSSAEGLLKQAAYNAFNGPQSLSHATIPPEDALPVVLKALTDGNANQRLFAASVLMNVSDDRQRNISLLSDLLKDTDLNVRAHAADTLIASSPGTEGIAAVVREALRSDDGEMVNRGQLLVASLLRRMANDEAQKAEAVRRTIVTVGPAVIPSLQGILEESAKAKHYFLFSNDKDSQERQRKLAAELIKAIEASGPQTQPTPEPKPEPKPADEPDNADDKPGS